MAGGKKQKVTGFTQAEQELLAVSGKIFHGFEIQKLRKIFETYFWDFSEFSMGGKVEFQIIFEKRIFRALADLRLARDRLFSGFMLSTLLEFQFGSKLEFINIQ